MALTKYQKGEILALTQSGRSRLYIMTEGQGKLVKLNYRGDELILRLVNKSDIISSMHFSRAFDTSIEFFEDSSLLSLSES